MDQFKPCYQFDEKTGIFLMEYRAQLSPTEPEMKDENGHVVREAVYISPVHSTFKIPPACKKNEIPRFSMELNAWGIIPDFRGETWYHKETGDPMLVVEAGMPHEDFSPAIDPEVALRIAKGDKVRDMQMKCSGEIVDGFYCDALGQKYRYPFAPTDQQNIIMAATSAMAASDPDKWSIALMCMDGKGAWNRVQHSAKQAIDVLHAAVAHRDALSAKISDIQSKIDKARDIADVQKITW